MGDHATYILPIADRRPLAWIVGEQRTAFPARRRPAAKRLRVGDVLLLYTTRGCFRNPTRDRGRLIGRAVVASGVEEPNEPIEFGDNVYPLLVELRIETLAPPRQGVDLSALVPLLTKTFPNQRAWSGWMRRALVPVAPDDVPILEGELARVTRPYGALRSAYVERPHPA